MDDLSVELNDRYWYELERWIEVAREVLETPEVKKVGAAPLPLIRKRLEARLA